MYQTTAIDTSQITSVNVSAVSSSLPEVTAKGVVLKAPEPSALVTSDDSLVITPQSSDWPATVTMFEELQQSGILTQEYQPPAPPEPIPVTPQPTLEPSGPISLANTTVTFERPNADYLLNQAESTTHLSVSLITGGVGVIIIIGIMGFTYFQLRQSGMDTQDIIQTTLDAVRLSR